MLYEVITTYLALNDTPSSFTSNAIPFVNSAGDALTQADTFVFNNGKLGIGTTTPSTTLSVAGNTTLDSSIINLASTSASSLIVNYLASTMNIIKSNTANAFTFATSTTATPLFALTTTTGAETATFNTDLIIGTTGSGNDLIV